MSLKDQRTERVLLQADFSHGLYSISNSIMSSHLHPIMSFSASLIRWVFDRLFGFKFDYSFFWVFECTNPFLLYLILCHVYILGMRHIKRAIIALIHHLVVFLSIIIFDLRKRIFLFHKILELLIP